MKALEPAITCLRLRAAASSKGLSRVEYLREMRVLRERVARTAAVRAFAKCAADKCHDSLLKMAMALCRARRIKVSTDVPADVVRKGLSQLALHVSLWSIHTEWL